ncbi:hypothetical protein D9M72_618030 [compost metagenome]
MHLAHLVVDPGVVKDALGGGGLACVHVRDDSDVAIELDGGRAGHDLLRLC